MFSCFYLRIVSFPFSFNLAWYHEISNQEIISKDADLGFENLPESIQFDYFRLAFAGANTKMVWKISLC